jgi:LEA14-like dessication related protein
MVTLKNPNPYGFSIYRSEFDVTYSGVYLGKAKLAKKVRIQANEEKTYSFTVSNDFKGVSLTEVMKVLSGASFKNQLELKGDLNAGKFLIRKKFPVSESERIKLN